MNLEYISVQTGDAPVLVADLSIGGRLHRIAFAIDRLTAREMADVMGTKPFKYDREALPYEYVYAGHTVSCENGAWSHYVEIHRGKSRSKRKVIV